MFESQEPRKEKDPWKRQSEKWDENWDGRQANVPETSDTVEAQQSKANRNLILIRHGQDDHVGDRRLSETGRQQSVATSHRLLEFYRTGRILSFASVISSTKPRAVESADLIHNELTTVLSSAIPRSSDDFLNEGNPCVPEPVPHWWSSEDEMRTLKEGPQIETAFRRYFHRAPPEQENDSYEILVCHGNIIRYFVCRALQFTPQGWDRFVSMANASITWIIVRPNGQVHLHCFNDAGHLPPDLVTV